jgi:hypothetical protein
MPKGRDVSKAAIAETLRLAAKSRLKSQTKRVAPTSY